MPTTGSGSATGVISPPAADYAPVRVWVFSRLKDAYTEGLLSDQGVPSDSPTYDALDAEVGSVVRSLVARFPCVVSYASLGGDDRLSFEEAAGLLTAARLLGAVTTGGAVGDLLLEKTDTTTRQFSQNNTPNNPGERARLVADAGAALGRVACVRAALAGVRAGFSLFGVTTPRRRPAFPFDVFPGSYGLFPWPADFSDWLWGVATWPV